MQFTHGSRHFGVHCTKHKNCLEKTVWKCGLRFKEKMAYVSTKVLLGTSAKTKKNKN